jgi:hypothetical protein
MRLHSNLISMFPLLSEEEENFGSIRTGMLSLNSEFKIDTNEFSGTAQVGQIAS